MTRIRMNSQVRQVDRILIRNGAAVISAVDESPLTALAIGAAHSWRWNGAVASKKERKVSNSLSSAS